MNQNQKKMKKSILKKIIFLTLFISPFHQTFPKPLKFKKKTFLSNESLKMENHKNSSFLDSTFGFYLDLKKIRWKKISPSNSKTLALFYPPSTPNETLLKNQSFNPSSPFPLTDDKKHTNPTQNLEAFLSIRKALLPEKNSNTLKKKWLKEFKHAGFTILKTKKLKQKINKKKYIFYLQKNQVQLKQIVFINDLKAVFLTCTFQAHNKKFKEWLKECNQITEGFNWL